MGGPKPPGDSKSREHEDPDRVKETINSTARRPGPLPEGRPLSPLRPDRAEHVDAHCRLATNQQTRRGAAEVCERTHTPPPMPATKGIEHRCRHALGPQLPTTPGTAPPGRAETPERPSGRQRGFNGRCEAEDSYLRFTVA